jgi:hypothetical protein
VNKNHKCFAEASIVFLLGKAHPPSCKSGNQPTDPRDEEMASMKTMQAVRVRRALTAWRRLFAVANVTAGERLLVQIILQVSGGGVRHAA